MSENSTSETPQIRLGNRPAVRQMVSQEADRLASIFPNADSAKIVKEARHNTAQDIRAERLKNEAERAKENGETDELTSLLNRKGFEKRLKEVVARAKRFGGDTSVVYFDINGLKGVNDESGHQAGDELIKRTAEVLQSSTRETDIVARLGGDEMVAILTGTNVEDATKVWEKMELQFKAKNVKIAAGIAQIDTATPQTVDESLRLADAAMYKAKAESKATGESKMRTFNELTPDETFVNRAA